MGPDEGKTGAHTYVYTHTHTHTHTHTMERGDGRVKGKNFQM